MESMVFTSFPPDLLTFPPLLEPSAIPARATKANGEYEDGSANESGHAAGAAAIAYHAIHAVAACRLFGIANHEDRDGPD